MSDDKELETAFGDMADSIETKIAEAVEDLRSDVEGLRETVAELTARIEELEAAQP